MRRRSGNLPSRCILQIVVRDRPHIRPTSLNRKNRGDVGAADSLFGFDGGAGGGGGTRSRGMSSTAAATCRSVARKGLSINGDDAPPNGPPKGRAAKRVCAMTLPSRSYGYSLPDDEAYTR